MDKLLESKFTAWTAMFLVVALTIITGVMRFPWWAFISVFFLFMAVFCHLISLYLRKINRIIGTKLEVIALICIILAIIGFLVEYVIFNFDFGI